MEGEGADRDIQTAMPTRAEFDAMARLLGATIPAEYLDGAVAAHALLHELLQALRAVPLPFLDFEEPEHAVRWIERGGRSSPADIEGRADPS
jgi:hypothetical protein